MLNGKWNRSLTKEERDWIQPLYTAMKDKATRCGVNSCDPCWLLDPDRNREYNLDNRYKKKLKKQKYVKGAPHTLRQYWIAFVAKYNKFPQHGLYKRSDPLYCELSHICGNKQCIAQSHIVHEFKSANRKRQSCHHFIRLVERNSRMDPGLVVRDLINVATAQRVDSSIPDCKCHGQKCFVNFGEAVKVRKRKRPRRRRDDFSPPPPRMSKRRRLNDEKWKNGKTVYLDKLKGFVRKMDGNRILFCRPDGERKQQFKEEWVSKDSKRLTFPHLRPDSDRESVSDSNSNSNSN